MTKEEKEAIAAFSGKMEALEKEKTLRLSALAQYHEDMKPIYEARARENAEFGNRLWRLQNAVEQVKKTKELIHDAIQHAEKAAFEHRIEYYSRGRVRQSIDCANRWLESALNPKADA